MKTGLVLEGGAMRGLFTAGVLDVLMENNIDFDGAVGVSAGACFGINYKSHQIGRTIRYNMRYCQDKRYGSWSSYLKSGNVFDAEFCYHELPLKKDPFDINASKENKMPFYVVASNIETGQAAYRRIDDVTHTELEWIRASAAIPLVSDIVNIEGLKLLDGGVADSIPLHFMETKGYEKNVVILTQPRDYRKEKNRFMPLLKRKYHDYPLYLKALENRHIHYNKTLDDIKEKEKTGELFVIAPPHSLHISAMQNKPRELVRVYEEGRIAANNALKSLKTFMGSH
ncbi:patatin-like phospholipase family protein [Kandleria vitulina]|jgi:predicted patatin/cPLA2 family phospholipase|uniref:patatin-like phospholipase family protein n=1 Tax=Kandleria vitulina TaxID=1630 RepID=UPI002E79FA21|nr:patatin family protein [Kandleria vitulina]MEE0989011.1 patatin family protein [Kandleria vitulina]